MGTKATKYKKEIKEKLDVTALESSVRGPSQVLACSALAVLCSLTHSYYFGKEKSIGKLSLSSFILLILFSCYIFDRQSFLLDFRMYPNESQLACAVISHYAVCLGDTLASELGLLSTRQPVLITMPWRKVPAGTNGGVTILGFVWSSLGGVLIAFATITLDFVSGLEIHPLFLITFGSVCGIVGSGLDSILGATLQVTFYDKDSKRVCCSFQGKKCTHVSGLDILSNAQVNFISVVIVTAFGGLFLGPRLFELYATNHSF